MAKVRHMLAIGGVDGARLADVEVNGERFAFRRSYAGTIEGSGRFYARLVSRGPTTDVLVVLGPRRRLLVLEVVAACLISLLALARNAQANNDAIETWGVAAVVLVIFGGFASIMLAQVGADSSFAEGVVREAMSLPAPSVAVELAEANALRPWSVGQRALFWAMQAAMVVGLVSVVFPRIAPVSWAIVLAIAALGVLIDRVALRASSQA